MVSFIDDFVSRADADAFEAMLQGTTPPSPAMSDLLSLTQQVASVPVPGPDPSFVAGLGATLRAEAAAGVSSAPASAAPVSAPPPSVLRVHGTWPKVLAGAAAGVVVAGTGLGVASQGALPGDALYAVRGVVDGLEVRLAGSDGAQGRVLLAHAREHVADTVTLAGRTPQVADDIRTSLSDAAASVASGQTELFAAFDATRDPERLQVVQEFTSWVQPQLQALRTKLPPEALGELATLQSTVDKGTVELRAKLVSCGDACSQIVVPAPAPSGTTSPSSTATAPSATPSVPSPSAPTTIPPLLTSPGATVTVPPPAVTDPPVRTTRPGRVTTTAEPQPRPTSDRPTRPRPTRPRTTKPSPSIPTSADPGLPGPSTPAPTTSPPTSPAPSSTTPVPIPSSTTPAPTPAPEGILVTPKAPRFADHCVPGNGVVHLPRTTGVRYAWVRLVGPTSTTVVVEANPEPGYVFAAGAIHLWAKNYPGVCGRP